ncbi:MAG: preprotein translocase subunit SecA [Candidatus Pacebacteria bacterium]|nr:preprotein translocase subunit SecA [Candidatus Paceibacterota bacterium]
MSLLTKLFKSENEKLINKFYPLVDKVLALEDDLKLLSDIKLKEKSLSLKNKIQDEIKIEEDILKLKNLNDLEFKKEDKHIIETILENNLIEAFALAREASRRTLGMMHYRVQIIGGIMMHKGYIAEMRTGEGKTLVATLPAYLNALSGKGVHVVTVNDYLSKRDAVWMGRIYDSLGLTIGILNHEVSYLFDRDVVGNEDEKEEKINDQEIKIEGNFKIENEYLKRVTRRDAYLADITYGTNNEFGFDYLRDNLVYEKDQLVQRGHSFAIVDEVDSILIDESRTPLIISSEAQDSDELYKRFARFVERLVEGEDYDKDEKQKAISLKPLAIEKVEKEFNIPNLYSAENVKLVHHLEIAVKAKALFIKEKQYVIKDVVKENGFNGKEIMIVDEFTGRMQPGRRWSEGLHQAIEAKENVQIQKESKTIASITYQNYFRFYMKLSGMSGTAKTSEEEFFKVYNIPVSEIPTNKKVVRDDKQDLIFQTEKGKLKALTREVKALFEKGQPVLIGTISIEKNEMISKYLERENVTHNILNAKNHEREGEIIAGAGKKHAVTIATNLAGRGVDIKLGGPNPTEFEKEEINNLGGLFVIGTERHEARRIDNQLRGRSGRQGDNGATQFFVSLEDDLMRIFGGSGVKNMMNKFGLPEDMPITSKMVSNMLEGAQEKIEGFHFDARKHTLQYDDVLNHQRQGVYERRRKVLLGDEKEINDILEELYLVKPELRDFVLEKEEKYTKEILNEVLKNIYLQIVDQYFMAHLEHMDHIRQSVNLRAYGQRDPLVEYKKEALATYRAMQDKMKEDFYNFITHIDNLVANIESQKILKESQMRNSTSLENKNKEIDNKKISRNDPCPCKSGKKVKKCDCLEYSYLRK